MASVILSGTPATVPEPSVSAISAVVAGNGIAVDNTNPEQPVVSADVASIVAGSAVAVSSDPLTGAITVGVNQSTPAADVLMLSIEADGTQFSTANFTAQNTGWHIFTPYIECGEAGFVWTYGTHAIQFWIARTSDGNLDPNSYITIYSAAQCPPGGGLNGLGSTEDTRIAFVYLTAGTTYTAHYWWSPGANLGVGGSAAATIQPFFAS